MDKVNVVYTRFVNTLTQTPTLVTLLPISPSDLPGSGKPDDREQKPVEPSADPKNGFGYIFAPDEDERCSTPCCRNTSTSRFTR